MGINNDQKKLIKKSSVGEILNQLWQHFANVLFRPFPLDFSSLDFCYNSRFLDCSSYMYEIITAMINIPSNLK